MDMAGFISLMNDHGFEDTSSSRKVAAINDAQADIASREPWPFLEKEIDLTFNGSSAVPTNVPSDLLAVLQVVNKSTGAVIAPSRADDWTRWFILSSTDVQDPFTFHFLGSQMRFHPIPGAGTSVRMLYTAYAPTLTDSSAESDFKVPPRHHMAIAFLALSNLYLMEDDPELSDQFEQQAEKRIQTMRSEIWGRQYQQPDFIHIVDTDDYDYYNPWQ